MERTCSSLHPQFVATHQNIAFNLRPTGRTETKSLCETGVPENFVFQLPAKEENSVSCIKAEDTFSLV
jgi:hypothetical protein